VAVTYRENRIELSPGNSFRWIDGKIIANDKELATQPGWLRGESSYNNVSLKHILSELENYYEIKINSENIDTSRLFTGSFTHKNLDLALKSVTIPLNLSYSKTGATVVLKRE
jgi:ferric-dicitrate binding protein FerR (iron transport regulator)